MKRMTNALHYYKIQCVNMHRCVNITPFSKSFKFRFISLSFI